jgi:phospholipid/cholesterol/gamma-HCH transport system substrate-binding protein
LEALTRNLNQIALENRENLRGAIYSIRVLADNLNRTLPKTIENIDRLAVALEGIASENRKDIREVVQNLRELSQGIKTEFPELAKILTNFLKTLTLLFQKTGKT